MILSISKPIISKFYTLKFGDALNTFIYMVLDIWLIKLFNCLCICLLVCLFNFISLFYSYLGFSFGGRGGGFLVVFLINLFTNLVIYFLD